MNNSPSRPSVFPEATSSSKLVNAHPGYKEENSNVGKMLANLRTQIPAGIVIAEYDPDFKSRLKTNYPDVKYASIGRPRIAYARHQAIMAAKRDIICNLDAEDLKNGIIASEIMRGLHTPDAAEALALETTENAKQSATETNRRNPLL